MSKLTIKLYNNIIANNKITLNGGKMNKLIKLFSKPYVFAIIYTIFIILFTTYIMLDALVLEKNVIEVSQNNFNEEEYKKIEKIFNDNTYQDENISINIKKDNKFDSNIYLIDVKIKDIKYLKSAFAKNKFGKNVGDITSIIARENNAILAINGDYYGFRDYGYVIRNNVMYRDIARKDGKDDCLLIYNDGTFKMIDERKDSLNDEIENAKNENKEIYQCYSFGPRLVENGKITENEDDLEIKGKNPRTAIGIIKPLHYTIVVCDGRSEESAGMTIKELQEYMLSLGCEHAYNLDGGSSTTLYFNGKIINKPSALIEREVSDIVYIGY